MFGVGFSEIIILVLLALLVLGPKEFPQAAKKFLKFIHELRDTFTSLKREVNQVKTEAEETILEVKQGIHSDLKKTGRKNNDN